MNKPVSQTEGRTVGAIDYFSSEHPFRRVATALALRARRKMFRQFSDFACVDADTKVIDVGVTPDRMLADSNYFEHLYPFPSQLTATSIEDAAFLEELVPGLRFVRTDGAVLPFPDRTFDVAFSSAVLEHVGGPAAQRAFIEEMCRVSHRVFLTTPNRWYPIEVHTFLPLAHWLPRHLHRAVLRRLGKSFWAEAANLHLVSARELAALFPPGANVTIRRTRTFGFTSNLAVYGTTT